MLHLGSVVVDIVLSVPALPERGGDVLATGTETSPGGGFNVMLAAARQGLPVRYAGAHGTGPLGDRARAAMAAAGVEVLLPPRTDSDTGFVVSLVDEPGERTFVTSPGAESTLVPEDLAGLRATSRDLVHLSGYSLLHPLNREALTGWLRALGPDVTVLLDPGPLIDLIPEDTLSLLLDRCDWWSCNTEEARRATGLDAPEAAAAELGRRLTRRGVLVRAGPDGCLLSQDGADPVHVPGFAVPTVDMNGAGDTHTGVFAAALATGADPLDAARRANAAAALSVTARGPATAPTAEVLDHFLAAQGGSR
jgi:sugar/nucleoside kinase (ribokinase family)